MSDTRKPIPLGGTRPRPVCPKCGQPSYSASGTHPQCMQRTNDQIAAKALKDVESEAAIAAGGAVPAVVPRGRPGRFGSRPPLAGDAPLPQEPTGLPQ